MSSDEGIAAFLAARLAEDEAMAKAAIQWGDGTWTQGVSEFDSTIVREEDASVSAGDMFIDRYITDLEHARHIARHDPARVLREVEAGRAEIALYREFSAEYERTRHGADMMRRDALETVLRHRAVIWSGHPDYREEWKPAEV